MKSNNEKMVLKGKLETKAEASTLTKKQREILVLVYRFRFVTGPLIARYYDQPYLQTANDQLNRLVTLGYLAKRVDPSYRLVHRPVEYYATTRCVKLFRELIEDYSERELKQLYVRADTSERFVHRSLSIFDIYLQLHSVYGEQLKFYSKPELNVDDYDYFPQPLPDGFFMRKGINGCEDEQCFFIEYFDDSVSVGIHARQISKYIKYFEDDTWRTTGLEFPRVIIVCESVSLKVRAQKRFKYLTIANDVDLREENVTIVALVNLSEDNLLERT